MQDFNGAAIFQQEAEDLLTQIEEVVLDIDPKNPSSDAINQLFRAFHTIKGSGHMFGFDAVAEFTHHVESALDEARNGSLAITPELIDLVLAARDRIRALIQNPTAESEAGGESDRIISDLAALGTAVQSGPSGTGSKQRWRIRFRPLPSAIQCGMNIGSVLSDVRELGETTITTHIEDVPALEGLQPDMPHIWWDIELSTEAELATVKNIFLFVEDNSELTVESADTTSAPATQNVAEPIAVPEQKPTAAASSVRVASDKLDRLVNLVGELVMNQSRLTQSALSIDEPAITAPVEEIERLVSELRDCVLGIRMMPIGSTFSRFKRLVHDLGSELNKDVELVTEGAETELDKTVLDQLGDPLVHLIRNSMDHGIEPAAERVQKGKPERATVRLTARHVGSNVVIAIHDDGKGIDPQVIRRKAIERGLLAKDANPTEKEILDFIFAPGFSTAREVTNLSGRGVGMDVVRKQIEALRGSVGVDSQVGRGTTISLTLPLTLAIIDGLLVQVSDEQFILPMLAVMENVELHRADRLANNGRNAVPVRGDLVPYVCLREAFGVPGEAPEIEKIVIVKFEDERVGLVVDRVLGSHQTVIQSLGRFYRDIEALSGATIMGDGRVALIIDVGGLVRSTSKTLCAGGNAEQVLRNR